MAEPAPDMIAPVLTVAEFMRTLDPAGLVDAFIEQPVILENFPPYLFGGADGAGRWYQGFRSRAAGLGLTGLTVAFGPAQDFSSDGRRAYFVLPTTWTGHSSEGPFTETGGWVFLLASEGGRWRIASYAWAVTSFQAG